MTDWDAPPCTNRGCKNGRIVMLGRDSVWIEVACGVCRGIGRMVEARPPAEPDRSVRAPVTEHAAVLGISGFCGQCFNARTILRGPQMASEPCPSCTPQSG